MSKPRKVHELKCLEQHYSRIESGEKTFEVRRDDRDYAEGDVLQLMEWDEEGFYTGRGLRVQVTCILRHGGFEGVAPGYCVMGIETPRAKENRELRALADEHLREAHGEVFMARVRDGVPEVYVGRL